MTNQMYSVDIDTDFDLLLAETIINNKLIYQLQILIKHHETLQQPKFFLFLRA